MGLLALLCLLAHIEELLRGASSVRARVMRSGARWTGDLQFVVIVSGDSPC